MVGPALYPPCLINDATTGFATYSTVMLLGIGRVFGNELGGMRNVRRARHAVGVGAIGSRLCKHPANIHHVASILTCPHSYTLTRSPARPTMHANREQLRATEGVVITVGQQASKREKQAKSPAAAARTSHTSKDA